MEGKSEVEQEEKSSISTSAPEEKSSAENAEVERKPEEKSSDQGTKKDKHYDGSGRRFDDVEKDEILDRYILTGQLPTDVTKRSLYDMKHHPRLELRRLYLEQAGLIKKTGTRSEKGKTGTTGKNGNNVLPLRRKNA